MRTNRLFWGLVLVILGGLLLLQTLGIITWNIWMVFWPALLILAGAWMLLGPGLSKRTNTTESLSIPLESAQEAVIDINHGAGFLKIGAGANQVNLVDGTFAGGVEHRVDYSSQWASLTLSTPSNLIFGIPGGVGSEGLRWDVRLNETIPMEVRLHTGAGETRADFSSVQVS
ncbi:MAG: LiaI-LiaF-like domain-containing protein, partial [Bellilinea sp.]